MKRAAVLSDTALHPQAATLFASLVQNGMRRITPPLWFQPQPVKNSFFVVLFIYSHFKRRWWVKSVTSFPSSKLFAHFLLPSRACRLQSYPGRACLLVMKSHCRHDCFIMTIIKADKQLVHGKAQRRERMEGEEK